MKTHKNQLDDTNPMDPINIAFFWLMLKNDLEDDDDYVTLHMSQLFEVIEAIYDGLGG